jgi:hypothetical protein
MPRVSLPLALLGGAIAIATTAMPPAAAAEEPVLRAETGRETAQGALFAAARKGDADALRQSLAAGARIDARDAAGRTALILAADGGHLAAVDELLKRGADPNLLDGRRYDALTLAGAAGRTAIVRRLLVGGASAKLVTSPYDGTALIASAHHGHVEVVAALIEAGAPLDHVNNIGWTAVMEAIVLGDGGRRHTETLRRLLEAGASPDIADKVGTRPLAHARQRGYAAMVKLLEKHGAKP